MAVTQAQVEALNNKIAALAQRLTRAENEIKTLQAQLARVKKG